MRHIFTFFYVVFVGIMVIACDADQLGGTRPTLVPKGIVCPPSPLGQELPLPQDMEGFIGRYYQNPGRIIEGIEFYFHVPIWLDSEIRETGLTLGDATMGDRHMLWLEKLICIVKAKESSPQGYSYHQVVDVIELPEVEGIYVVDLNTCLINGTLARNTVGMGKVTDESHAPSEPLYAWQVNINDEKIVPFSTQNMKCYFDFSYPKQ